MNNNSDDASIFCADALQPQIDFKLTRVKFLGNVKWVKVKTNNNEIQYWDFIAAAKKCFDIANYIDIEVRDEEGVIIDEEIFTLLKNITYMITLNTGVVLPPPPSITSLSSTSAATDDDTNILTELSSLPDLSDTYVDEPVENTCTNLDQEKTNIKRWITSADLSAYFEAYPPLKRLAVQKLPCEDNVQASTSSKVKIVSPSPQSSLKINVLKELEQSSTGQAIITEYNKTKSLTAHTRRNLVNLVVKILVERYGHHPSREQKIECAEGIINAFPNLKDPASNLGYEAFYDPQSRSGFIAWRLRTLWRRRLDKENLKPQASSSPSQSKTINPIEKVDDKTVQEQLEFLRHACSRTQRKSIQLAMKDTFHYRRSITQDIFKIFPRFLDIPYLIEIDFALMFPEVQLTDFNEDLILEVGNRNLIHSSTPADDSDEWDKVTSAYLCLLKLLPPTAKGKKKAGREGIHSVIDRLILFHKIGNPLENLVPKTTQPCLIAVGPNRKAISSYFIAVEGNMVPIDARSPNIAFDLLFKSYFVFNTEYDPNLKSFFNFIQVFYYKMELIDRLSARMREVRAWLSHHVEEQ